MGSRAADAPFRRRVAAANKDKVLMEAIMATKEEL